MRAKNEFRVVAESTAKALCLLVIAGLLILPACTVKKDENGGNKNIKVDTPVGGVHVSTQADAKDVGLALYPGAAPRTDHTDDSSSANVNIATGFFGLRVVALKYTTNDSPDKVTAFYKKELARYGDVLECPASKASVTMGFGKDEDRRLSCDKDHHSDGSLELKAGKQDYQHIVSVKPAGSGSEFTLVYVSARGKDEGAL
jgi:hypothetical protein